MDVSPMQAFAELRAGMPALSQTTRGPAESPHPSRDRRREKAQLSCNFCRGRKVRCDRQLPCKTCIMKDIGASCTYSSDVPQKQKGGVSDRIQHLEALVRSLMQQQELPAQEQTATNQHSPGLLGGPKSAASIDIREPVDAYTPSDSGSTQQYSHGASYVGNVHWAAVLDSISDLKDHYEEEEQARLSPNSRHMLGQTAGPRLLYEPVKVTVADILSSLPSRQAVDRLVARYFHAQSSLPLPILHSQEFLQQYERFWHDPSSTNLLWVGLLFSILALSAQFQLETDSQGDVDSLDRPYHFREQIIHCLVLGHYTKGRDYVVETLLNYITLEILLGRDADLGIWLVLGMLVQLALSLGYHRDPKHFSDMSPFTGEMRRRVWAVLVQMDLRLSSQMGLPRLLKLHQCDTTEPRNLLDIDFGERTVELPPSRPEAEVTPVLYLLAKNRIDRVSDLISDALAQPHDHPYTITMDLDRKIQEAQASLPTVFQWQPLGESFLVQPQVIMHRVWLHLSKQRLSIWLHRRYLTPTYASPEYQYSRDTCLQAAMVILEFQQLLHKETQPDGLLHSVRFMAMTSLAQFVFLLGMSVLSYYVQLSQTRHDAFCNAETCLRARNLLIDSYVIWKAAGRESNEARKAARYLSRVLGLHEPNLEAETPNDCIVGPSELSSGIRDDLIFSPEQLSWQNPESLYTSWENEFLPNFSQHSAVDEY